MPNIYIPNLEIAVKPYIGMPYRTGPMPTFAESASAPPAFDCWSFIYTMLTTNFDIVLNPNLFVNMDRFLEIWYHGDKCSYIQDLREWDIALFALNGPFVDHCALVIYPEKIVHATPQSGVRIDYLEHYEHKLFQIARLQDLA